MISGNPGTLNLLGAALETWANHLVDSENNSRPVRGRDGLGWGTPMSPEFRQVIKTVAFGWRPTLDGMGAPKFLMAARRAPVPTPDLAREMTERFFSDFPELRGAKYVGQLCDEFIFETPREKLTETGRTSYEGKTFQTPRELTGSEIRQEAMTAGFDALYGKPRETETMTPVARAEVAPAPVCCRGPIIEVHPRTWCCVVCGRQV